MRQIVALLVVAVDFMSGAASAATNRNNINLDFGPQFDDGFHAVFGPVLTGNIVTDGTLGDLTAANVPNWESSFEVAASVSTSNSSAPGALEIITGSTLVASGRELRLGQRVFRKIP